MRRDLPGAVVLAGGSSSRMGRDKALLSVDGERLVDRVVRIVGEVADRVVVASGHRRLAPVGAREVRDPEVGPLGAIAAGLRALGVPAAAVVAVDQPDPCPGLLVALADLLGDAPCAVPVVDGRLQPLHAVWAGSVLGDVEAALEAGQRSPVRLLERLPARTVQRDVWARYDRSGAFAVGWNEPEDLDERADPASGT